MSTENRKQTRKQLIKESMKDNKEKIEKKIKKAIIRSIKYLRKYRLEVMDREKTEGVNDGGVSIMLAYFQGHYGINFGYEDDCHNLYQCARNFQEDHPRSILNFKQKKNNELFSNEFLKDIFFQKKNKYPIEIYVRKLEKQLNGPDSFLSQLSNLIPGLDLFNQPQTKYINVALALFGLAEKKHDKALMNKSYKKLKRKVVNELVKIFRNDPNYDSYYFDTLKSYSLVLIALLGNLSKINSADHLRFIVRLIKNQSIDGSWVHSDLKDGNDQINNLLLTIFSLGTLLEYTNTNMIRSHSSITNIKLKQNTNNLTEGFMGFGGGGFLTQKNMDNMWGSPCIGSSIEIIALIAIIIIGIYIFIKLYQNYYV